MFRDEVQDMEDRLTHLCTKCSIYVHKSLHKTKASVLAE